MLNAKKIVRQINQTVAKTVIVVPTACSLNAHNVAMIVHLNPKFNLALLRKKLLVFNFEIVVLMELVVMVVKLSFNQLTTLWLSKKIAQVLLFWFHFFFFM